MKKFIALVTVTLIALIVIVYGACIIVANLRYDIDKLKAANATLQKQAAQAQQEKEAMAQKTQVQTFDAQGIIQQIELIATEKDANNALYGDFDVAVTVKNITQHEITNLKIVTQLQKSLPDSLQVNPETTIQTQGIKKLAPGKVQTITFKDFKVSTPELVHELIVSAVGFGDLQKIRIKVAAPPEQPGTRKPVTSQTTPQQQPTTSQPNTPTTPQTTPVQPNPATVNPPANQGGESTPAQ